MNMTIWVSWVDCHSGAIQAVCAVLGLCGLYWYCWLTLGIHQAAVRQANAAIRPFIMIDELKEEDDPDFRVDILPVSEKKVFIVRNLGNGPAVDIQWITNSAQNAESVLVWNKIGDLAAGDWSHLANAKSEFMFVRPTSGTIIRFSDVADNKYETIEEYRGGVFYSDCRPRKK